MPERKWAGDLLQNKRWRAVLSDAPIVMPMPEEVVPSAVLITLTNDEVPYIILTRRSAALSKHAGQISFPGGRVDEGDESLIATALREAQEEIALAGESVTICGFLPDMLTGTGYRITPIVGHSHLSKAQLERLLIPHPAEVDEILFVPLTTLLDSKNYDSFWRQEDTLSWQSWRLVYEGQTIWGATAAILHHWAGAL